jgi:hypothetical protein
MHTHARHAEAASYVNSRSSKGAHHRILAQRFLELSSLEQHIPILPPPLSSLYALLKEHPRAVFCLAG